MTERSTELMSKASRQLSEMAEFFGTLKETDLRKPCPDEGAGHGPGDTVGEVAAHAAEGYHLLGRFLQATRYVPGSPTTGTSHKHCRPKGHGHRHERAQAPVDVSVLLDQLTSGKVPIGLLADLSDEQLDSVPPVGSSRFSDGLRTLHGVIDAVVAHQGAHLVTLKRAVA